VTGVQTCALPISLQKMVAKEVPVDEGLDQLAANVDKQLKDAGLG